MPRFVILEHDHPHLHWDLMLQAGEVLQTWRLEQAPQPGVRITSTALDDHRAMYLDYEGPVSGNRGAVKRWDSGDFDEEPASTPSVRLFRMHGLHVRGHVRLEYGTDDACIFCWFADEEI